MKPMLIKTYSVPDIRLDISKFTNSFNLYNTLWGKGHYFHFSGHENQPQVKYLISSTQWILSVSTEHLVSASPWVKSAGK